MRIQHNILAMNSYRNYTNNVSALGKNLEKLSSGYKINRAGDDAAGLAISEKMRAQITGLNAAQKNVKDGISLVKTAEGAMQEIQDMLNRMDYLATQSANGTYQDEVDREALQKEVNQLNDEINRIAQSANFNGIPLLDGSWDPDGKANAIASANEKIEALQNAKVDPVYSEMSNSAIQGLMLEQSANNDPTDAAEGVGKKTILETDGNPAVKPSFRVSLNGINLRIDKINGAGSVGISVSPGSGAVQKLEVTEKDLIDMKYAANTGDKVSSEDLALAIVQKNNGALVTLDGVGYKVTAEGEDLVFKANEEPTGEVNAHYTITLHNAVSSTNVDAKGITYISGEFTAGSAGETDHTATVTVSINGKEYGFTTTDQSSNATAGQWATALNNATATVDGKRVALSKYFAVTAGTNASGDTVLKFEDVDKTDKGSGNTVSNIAISGTTSPGTITGGIASTDKATPAYKTGVDGYSNFGTQDIKINLKSEVDQLASTSITFTDLDITDGMKITLGDESYVFAVGADSKYKDGVDGAKVIDLTKYKADDLKSGTAGSDTVRGIALSKLTEAASDNKTFTVGQELGSGLTKVGSLTLKQKAEVKDSTDMSSMEKFASYIGISTVDAEATAKKQAELDAENAEKIAAEQEKLDAAEALDPKTLQLQIGDTSDDFNQLQVKIGSMKTTALGVDGLSISTAEDAKNAIGTIKDAINYVSSVRGDLGAYQNRLEHTQNNLSVMAENIQDAESTIRDTDVAEEMMSYVKNNILVQSAQAMLAQANQVPQGVLQLLG